MPLLLLGSINALALVAMDGNRGLAFAVFLRRQMTRCYLRRTNECAARG